MIESKVVSKRYNYIKKSRTEIQNKLYKKKIESGTKIQNKLYQKDKIISKESRTKIQNQLYQKNLKHKFRKIRIKKSIQKKLRKIVGNQNEFKMKNR